MKILHNARVLETRIRVKRETNKQIKRQRYRIYLQQNSQHLPSRKKLLRWRRNLMMIGTLFILIPGYQILCHYQTIWKEPKPLKYDQEPTIEQIWLSFLNMIPTIFGAIFLMLWSFAMAVDWVIYRRWGNTHTILNW